MHPKCFTSPFKVALSGETNASQWQSLALKEIVVAMTNSSILSVSFYRVNALSPRLFDQTFEPETGMQICRHHGRLICRLLISAWIYFPQSDIRLRMEHEVRNCGQLQNFTSRFVPATGHRWLNESDNETEVGLLAGNLTDLGPSYLELNQVRDKVLGVSRFGSLSLPLLPYISKIFFRFLGPLLFNQPMLIHRTGILRAPFSLPIGKLLNWHIVLPLLMTKG